MTEDNTGMFVTLNPGSYSGFVLDSLDNSIVVSKVDPGSPAEKIGIFKGLKVLSVNDKSIENWTISQVQNEIENATHPLKIQLDKFNIETNNTQSSQISSKNLGTDDKSSQSIGSRSSIINIKSTSSINPPSINIYSKSNSNYNQSITTSIQSNSHQSDFVTNLTTESKATHKIDSSISQCNSAQNKLTDGKNYLSTDKVFNTNMDTNKINSCSASSTQQNNALNSLNQNTDTYAALVVQSSSDQKQVQSKSDQNQAKNAENVPNYHSKRIIVSKPVNLNTSTVKLNKTVSYTPDTLPGDFETTNNKSYNLPINISNVLKSSSFNSESGNVSEITSRYWPAGTLITLEQQMELEKKQQIENESLYSKVIPKNKSTEKINIDESSELQLLENCKYINNGDILKKESIYNEIKMSPDASPTFITHDLAKVSSDITHDVAKIEVESALNLETGRRRSRSVPISEINLDVNKDVNVPLSRKSSSVDRKFSNHTIFGKSFFSRIFGSQKKRKEQKLNKTGDNLTKNAQNSSYEALVNVVPEKKSNSEKYEILKHAETYLVVERGKKGNKLQSRDSMNSIDEGSSCMPACVCLNPKSKRNSYRIDNKSPELKNISNTIDIQSINNNEKSNLKEAGISSNVDFKADTISLKKSNIKNEPSINIETNDQNTQIVIESALKEKITLTQTVEDKLIEPTIVKTSNSIINTVNKFIPSFKNNANVTVDNSNLRKYSEEELGSNLIIEKAVSGGLNVKNQSASFDTNNGSKIADNNVDVALESNNISKSDNVQKECNFQNKLINKPTISPKLFVNITKEAYKFHNEIPEKEINVNTANTILDSNTRVQISQPSLEKNEIIVSTFELQDLKANNIYDNTDSNVYRNQIDFKNIKESDYDTIDIKDTFSKSNDINKYIPDNKNITNLQFNSNTLPLSRIKNEAALNQTTTTSLSNLNERNLPQSPIYDVPSFGADIQISPKKDDKLINSSTFSSNLRSNNYDNKENINHSAFTQNQFDNNHSIDTNTKTNETNRNNFISPKEQFDDEIFSGQTENIYEKIQLTPDVIRKDNSNTNLLEKKTFKNFAFNTEYIQQKSTVKPLMNLNDLVLPVYTRINPHLSHEVVKPEPIKPSHLNLNKISYSHFEKKEAPKNVDEILKELLSSQDNTSSNPSKSINILQDYSQINKTQNNYYGNKQNNYSFDTNITKINNINQNKSNFNNNLQKNNENFAQNTHEQNNCNINSIAKFNNNTLKELNSYETTNNYKTNDTNGKNIYFDNLNTASNYTDPNDPKVNITDKAFSLLQFDSQNKVNVNSDFNNTIYNINNASMNTQNNVLLENYNYAKNNLNTIKEFERLDASHTDFNINNSSLNTKLESDCAKEKQNQSNVLDLEKKTNLFDEKYGIKEKAESFIPNVIITGPSTHSTLNTKIEENESMVEKQKRKKYRLRLCVDTAALRSWIVH